MDPYQVLGVPHGSDMATIRHAYHRLSRQHHPDVGGTTARMRELNAAYALVNAVRAARSAAPGHRWPSAGCPRPARVRSVRIEPLLEQTRHWLVGTRTGQWLVTLAILLALHQVALASVQPGGTPSLLEGLAALLVLRLQASLTPPGRTFAPARDMRAAAIVLLRSAIWIADRP